MNRKFIQRMVNNYEKRKRFVTILLVFIAALQFVTILWDEPAEACGIESTFVCPETSEVGQPFTCTFSINTESGTVPAADYTAPIVYTWGDTGGGEITNAVLTGSTYNAVSLLWEHTYEVTVRLLGPGTAVINAHGYVPDDTSYAPQDHQATVVVPEPTVTLDLACPPSLYVSQHGTCSTVVETPAPTDSYAWSSSGNITPNNDSADVVFSDIGGGLVTVNVSIDRAPELTADPPLVMVGNAMIDVKVPSITATLDCPDRLHIGETGNCTVAATIAYGSLQYEWYSGGKVTGNDSLVEVVFDEQGRGNVNVVVKMAEAPQYNLERMATVDVAVPEITSASLTCPESLWITEQGDCIVDASATWGTLQYEWASSGNVSDRGSSATVSFETADSGDVTVKVSLAEFPDVYQTVSAKVSLQVPQISATISCPEKLWKHEKGTCTVDATTTWGSLHYDWDSTGVIINNGPTAQVSFSEKGSGLVTALVSLTGAPSVNVSEMATINVESYVTPVVTIDGPTYTYKKKTHTFTITDIYSPSGPVNIKWFVNGTEYGTGGDSITYTFTEPSRVEIKVEASVKGSNGDPDGLGERRFGVYVSDFPKPVTYITRPQAIFINEEAEFKVKTYVPSGIEKQLYGRWILPSGKKRSGDRLLYTFRQTGRQQIKYEAWYEGYEEDAVIRTVNVYPIEYVFPDFTISTYRGTEGVIPFLTYFKPAGDMKKASGKQITYSWDFGDGTTQTTTRATYIYKEYKAPGVYTVTLDVIDEDGNTDSDTTQLVLTEPDPIELEIRPSFSNAFMRAPLSMYARMSKTGGHPRDRITSYDWKIDGVPMSNRSLLYHTLEDPGNYNLALDITTMYDNSGADTKSITVNENQPPVCNFTWKDYPTSKVTYFTPQCEDPDGRVIRYFWTLGDGTETTSPRAYGKYKTSGSYEVTLTAYDDSDTLGSVTKTVTVER